MAARDLQSLIIRDIKEIAEMREVEELQKDVWGVADREVFPALALVPMIELGAVLIGAFDGDRIAGFVFGFPGYQPSGDPGAGGRVLLHSDMLAVRPEYRSRDLGYKLKLAQRERALANGIDTISWTFDPLQSLNAHLNFGKLGVIADRYCVNYYGQTTSFLHRAGTDRLWVTWLLNSERVLKKIAHRETPSRALANFPAVVHVGENCEPLTSDYDIGQQAILIEVPSDINDLVEEDLELAIRWREATRSRFTSAIAEGYVVDEFYRVSRKRQMVGVYLLSKKASPSRSNDE